MRCPQPPMRVSWRLQEERWLALDACDGHYPRSKPDSTRDRPAEEVEVLRFGRLSHLIWGPARARVGSGRLRVGTASRRHDGHGGRDVFEPTRNLGDRLGVGRTVVVRDPGRLSPAVGPLRMPAVALKAAGWVKGAAPTPVKGRPPGPSCRLTPPKTGCDVRHTWPVRFVYPLRVISSGGAAEKPLPYNEFSDRWAKHSYVIRIIFGGP
jgi:hypothetical protein